VIPAVHKRGNDVGGLLRYLFGPGKREEHVRPRLVAAWNGAGPLADLQPPRLPGGWHDVRRLTELLEQPVRAGFNPPAETVWHCSIRAHPSDRVLSDDLWGHIAGEVVAAVGLAAHSDPRAVRWVAVRHNDDHIHVVATLVRQDRRTAWPWQDKRKAQAACRDLEERYGLYRVAAPGTGSRRWPTAAEMNKAARLAGRTARSTGTRWTAAGAGRPVVPREQLRRRVRETAAVATDEMDFFARLARAGIAVKLRHSTRDPGQVTGYAVGLPGHTTAAGTTVFYGGGRLAPDLTLPRLRSRWIGTSTAASGGTARRVAATGTVPPGVSRWAADAVDAATAAMRDASGPAVAATIASAAADLLSATAQAWEGRAGGPLSDAADAFDRAAHDRARVPAPRVSHAVHLRSMGRLIALLGRLTRDEDTMAALRLVYALAALAESLADLREAQRRLHQVRAARDAAARLRAWIPPVAGTPRPAGIAPGLDPYPHRSATGPPGRKHRSR
jgi:hypothetical protein